MIDLERIDELDPVKDADKIGKMVDEAYKGQNAYLDSLARVWEKNIRFYEGDQWIYWNDTSRNYERIPETKFNKFIPRPVTNLLLPIEQTMTSLLTRNKATVSVSKNSDNEFDEMGARVASRVLDAKWEIDQEDIQHMRAAKIMQLCGTVFREDIWNPTKGGSKPLQTSNGEVNVSPGDNEVKMWTPFEVIPDRESQSWFIKATMEPVWWIRWAYGKTGDGYTGLAEKVKPDRDFSNALQIRYALKESTGVGHSVGGEDSAYLKGHAVLKCAYIQPTRKHRKGLMVVTANGKTLYCGPSPYFDELLPELSWHPFSWAFWEMNPFRFHGLSLFENLTPIQKRINSIDALIILNRMLNVSPQWVLPKGCQVPEGYINGKPGLEIWASPIGANGMMPTKVPGMNLSTDVWKERQDLITQLHMIAGDNEIMQGQRPEGVNTLGGLNMLLEQSYSKYSPLIRGWEKFIEMGQQKKLLMIARRYKEERPDFTKKLQALNGDNLDVEIGAFVGMNLRDNIDVRIEAGSSLPKSKIVHQNNMIELAKMNLLGDITPTGNPIANQQFLSEFGISTVDTNTNADVRKAKFNVGVMKGINEGRIGMDMYPVLMPFDDLDIHKKVTEDAMKTPGFKDKMGVFNKKYGEIMTQMAQMRMPPPPPMGAPPGAPPMPPQPQPPPGSAPMPPTNPLPA